MNNKKLNARSIFMLITAWPRMVIMLGLLFIALTAMFIPNLVKNTSSDAFIADDNPAVVYRDRVKQIFGLDDPFVIALVNEHPSGIYTPEAMEIIKSLTTQVKSLPNVDPDRVTSLATESNIEGTDDGMEVTDFFEILARSDNTDNGLSKIKAAIEDFPLFQGSLVARDGSATLIIAEVLDESLGQETYNSFRTLVENIEVPAGISLHVAGEGAVSGFLGEYIDADAKRLNPISALVITLVLIIAFRSLLGALIPNLIVVATAAGSIGLMAATGIEFFVITNGLPVILIGIAVADAIHILSEYYDKAKEYPDHNSRELIVDAMESMWRPVTLTTVTTIAGFAGLWFGSDMPPMRFFGLFAAIGVAIAWLFSLTFLPAAVSLFRRPEVSTKITREKNKLSNRFMVGMGNIVLKYPARVVIVVLAVTVVGVTGATRVVVEEAQIENFQKKEPIVLADKAINAHLDGVNYLDIVIETNEKEALFEPEKLHRIERLQAYAETLPGVQGSTSIVDYLKQMHKAVNENQSEAYVIPDDAFLNAQLFLLYNSSADPTDFQEEVDYDYKLANVRLRLNTGYYGNSKKVIEKLEHYISEDFNNDSMQAHLSGRVFVNYHWLENIGTGHVNSVLISLVLVWLMAAIVFRSLFAGLFALIPIGISVMLVYAVMGFGGIWLGVGTSMFAAIAIGLGIDFSIHTIDRMRVLVMNISNENMANENLVTKLAELFPSTGKALLFNFLAIGLGFLVLATSEVPALIKFGTLVAVSVTASFLASMMVLPALTILFKPAFIVGPREKVQKLVPATARNLSAVLLAIGFGGMALLSNTPAQAEELPDGLEIMQKVVDRNEGEWVTRRLQMEMIDKNGTKRVRETKNFRRYFGQEKRTVLFYTSPANVKGTGFLTHDYPESDRDDDQWLYLPALRKVRRISASDRGDYFLGTDFTYEDIKKENKVAIEDYTYKTLRTEEVDGHKTYVIEGKPVSDKVADELGYGRSLWHVDPAIWISRKTEIWDVAGNSLKTILTSKIKSIDNIWTVHNIKAINHKTGHKTTFAFSEIDYGSEVKEKVFKKSALKRGLK